MRTRVLAIIMTLTIPLSSAANGQATHHSSYANAVCKVAEVAAPHAVGDGKMMNGAFITVGGVYHAGDLSIRVNGKDADDRYDVDIKTPDYAQNWHIRINDRGPTFKACGAEISIAIIYNSETGRDALMIGVF